MTRVSDEMLVKNERDARTRNVHPVLSHSIWNVLVATEHQHMFIDVHAGSEATAKFLAREYAVRILGMHNAEVTLITPVSDKIEACEK